jgi:hypothetical protein
MIKRRICRAGEHESWWHCADSPLSPPHWQGASSAVQHHGVLANDVTATAGGSVVDPPLVDDDDVVTSPGCGRGKGGGIMNVRGEQLRGGDRGGLRRRWETFL